MKALRIESPPSVKHPWTTATLESRSFAITRPPHVSLLLKRLTLVAASAIASCVSELLHVTSKSSDEEKEKI